MVRGLAVLSLLAAGCSAAPRALLENKGSDTLVNLAQSWAEAYREVRPELAVAVSGGGSGTGLAALIQGTVDIANSSRPIKREEVEAAAARAGRPVVGRVVALDALAVFVHPKNPLGTLSVGELACIFGEGGECERWDQLRGTVVPGCKDNQIVRVSRQSNSGTYQYFRDVVVGKRRDFKLGSMDMNGSREGIDLVATTPCAIGYSGLGYLGPTVKPLCLEHRPGEPCVPPTKATAADGSYPIARELFMYTLGEPTGDVRDFLEWIATDHGRAIVESAGYVNVAKDQRGAEAAGEVADRGEPPTP